ALSLFRYASRPYIFTASPSPSTIATTREALRQIRARPELKDRVWHNANRVYEALSALGLKLGPDVSPVIGVNFAERNDAFVFWQALLSDGVYTNLILPPAAPDGGSLIRCSLTAAHSDEEIDSIIGAFSRANIGTS
ncbi:MAG: aminotransferase class I/II-fold pyridoxal phosphate-dependent enzyme, partial [Gammaproteobacteria bacterium]